MLILYSHTLLIIFTARCLIPAERSRVVIGGMKRWPFDVTDAVVPHGENVTFYCKHPRKQCRLTATETCFDGKLQPPACYLGKHDPPIQGSPFSYLYLFQRVDQKNIIETFWQYSLTFSFVFQSPHGCSINSSLTGWSPRLKHASLVMWSDDLDPSNAQ